MSVLFSEKDLISFATDWSQSLSPCCWLCNTVYWLVELAIRWCLQICIALTNFKQPFRLIFSIKLMLIFFPLLFSIYLPNGLPAFQKDQLFYSLAVSSSPSALQLSSLSLQVDREQVFCEGWALTTYPSWGISLKSSKLTHLWRKIMPVLPRLSLTA